MEKAVLRHVIQEAYDFFLDEFGAYLNFLGSACEVEQPDLVDCFTEYLYSEGVRYEGALFEPSGD